AAAVGVKCMKGPSISEIESVHQAREKCRSARRAIVTIDDKRTWGCAVTLDVSVHAGEKCRSARRAIVTIDDKRTWGSAVTLDVIAVVAQTAKAEHVLERQPDDAGDRVTRHRAEEDNRC